MSEHGRIVEALGEAIAEVRAAAEASFGWAHLELELSLADGRHALVGTVAAPRSIARLRQALARRVPGLVVDTDAIAILRTDAFVALPPGITTIWRRPDRELPAELATELVPDDGPVELLHRRATASFVRALDGTSGWAHVGLGPACAPPQLPAARALASARLAAEAHAWIDVPYRAGGTQPRGVDCSGLVQRLLAAIGARVPRHSADQLALDPRESEGKGDAGDVVALWSRDEAACHVGLSIGDGHIVHASRSRGRVIVEDVAHWRARAQRIAHVPIAAIALLQRRAAGRRGLGDVLPLGRAD